MTPAPGVGDILLNTWSMRVLVPVGENRVGDEIKGVVPPILLLVHSLLQTFYISLESMIHALTCT